MRKIDFDPERDYPTWTKEQQDWWDRWRQRAKDATTTLLTSNTTPRTFNSAIWSDLKAWLLKNFFNGKCAYCEVYVSAGFFGEGEHFRPKGGVRVKNGTKLVSVLKPGSAVPHGGYYWLAYEGRNLLPSCDRCNNYKTDQFPVGGAYIFDPPPQGTDLDKDEDPLLVHPCRDDPSEHLTFGVQGIVAGKDEKGSKTIEIFKLDRAELETQRKLRQEEALTRLALAVSDFIRAGTALEVSMQSFTGEGAQYSAAVKEFLKPYLEKVKALQL
jgi:hypothetical protein